MNIDGRRDGAGARAGEFPPGSTMRWDWWPGDDRVHCAVVADGALARAADGVALLADWIDRIEARDRRFVEAGLREFIQRADGCWQARYLLRRPGGAPVLVEHVAIALGPPGTVQQRVVGSVRMVGADVAADLRGLSGMFDDAADAILVRDMNHRILYCNRAAAVRYGWTASEMIGRSVHERIFAGMPGDEFATAMRTLMRLGDFAGRMAHRRRDGETVLVHSRWTLVREASGLPRCVLSISTDLRERADLEERLVQARKLEALGALAVEVAHDFNNLLTVIIGNAEELADELRGRSELGELAFMIQGAGRRGAQLTQRLLAFARNQAPHAETCEVSAMLGAIEPLLRKSLGKNIVLGIECATGDGRVFADCGQFETALLNLCINARDAMPRGGVLAIHARMASVTAETARLAGLPGSGDYMVLTVSDDGIGIPAAVLPQVFDPFFTTRSGGSGMGLSMVHGFVRESKGHVTISSKSGCGTVVTIYLPCAGGAPRDPALPSPPTLQAVHAVLLDQDDPA